METSNLIPYRPLKESLASEYTCKQFSLHHIRDFFNTVFKKLALGNSCIAESLF